MRIYFKAVFFAEDVYKRQEKERYIKRAGITEVSFHCLRHTFATRALENDIPTKVVSELLGHYSVTIILDLYSHVFMESKRKAVEKLT